ncbi:hypothetical protein HKD37_02G005034 [Glycine soja]
MLGRPSLNALGAIISTPYLAMKLPSYSGSIITVHANQRTTREYVGFYIDCCFTVLEYVLFLKC